MPGNAAVARQCFPHSPWQIAGSPIHELKDPSWRMRAVSFRKILRRVSILPRRSTPARRRTFRRVSANRDARWTVISLAVTLMIIFFGCFSGSLHGFGPQILHVLFYQARDAELGEIDPGR